MGSSLETRQTVAVSLDLIAATLARYLRDYPGDLAAGQRAVAITRECGQSLQSSFMWLMQVYFDLAVRLGVAASRTGIQTRQPRCGAARWMQMPPSIDIEGSVYRSYADTCCRMPLQFEYRIEGLTRALIGRYVAVR